MRHRLVQPDLPVLDQSHHARRGRHHLGERRKIKIVSRVLASGRGEVARSPKAFWWTMRPPCPTNSTAPVITWSLICSCTSRSTGEKFAVSFTSAAGFFFFAAVAGAL